MNTAPGNPPATHAWKVVLALALYIGVGLWLACLTSILIFNLAPHLGSAVSDFVARKSEDSLLRRSAMIWAVLFLPLLLKQLGWQGRSDFGWTDSKSPRRRYVQLVARGIGIGLLSLGVVCGLILVVGARAPTPLDAAQSVASPLILFALSGLTVAIIEETLARGVLFRPLIRAWGIWPAALVSSLLFAGAHFIHGDPATVRSCGLLPASFKLLASALAGIPNASHFLLRFINLALLGIVLCSFAARTGTIWIGVGAHAAWVWVMKVNGFLSDTVTSRPWTAWWGQRGDSTDSLLATAALLIVLLAVRPRPFSEQPAS